jgi:hypothetical protein
MRRNTLMELDNITGFDMILRKITEMKVDIENVAIFQKKKRRVTTMYVKTDIHKW